MLSGRNEPDRAARAGRVHRSERIGQQWMPIAHPDVDGKRVTCRCEPLAKTSRLPLCDRRNRRDAAKELVVMRDVLHALRADAAAAQDIGQKRTDVVETLGPPEGYDED